MNFNINSEIINRISVYYNIDVAGLSAKCGYDRPQAFYDVIKGKTKRISKKMADRISENCPEINYDFIAYGKEPMLKSENITINSYGQGTILLSMEGWEIIKRQIQITSDQQEMIKSQQDTIASMQRRIEFQEEKIDSLNREINFLKKQIPVSTKESDTAGDAQDANVI